MGHRQVLKDREAVSGLRVVMGELGISPAVSGNKALLIPIWEHSSDVLPVSPVS